MLKQSSYEIPIIRNSDDLVPIMIKVMKKLNESDQNVFSTEIVTIVNEMLS